MAAAWPQADRRVRGGADAWDDGPAGLVLAEDYFPAPAAGGDSVWAGSPGTVTASGVPGLWTPGAAVWAGSPGTVTISSDGGWPAPPAPAAVGTALVTDRTDPAWVAAVKARTRTVTSRVDLLDDTDTVIGSLPVTGGDIEYTSAAISWAGRLALSGRPDMVPASWLDPLDARSRTRARVVWAVDTPDGWLEWVVCTLDLEDPTITETATGIDVTVEGHDTQDRIRRAGYGPTVLSLGGLTVTAALRQIFATVAPLGRWSVPDTSTVLPATFEVGTESPARDWTDIAAAAGWVVRTDRFGVVTAGPWPDPVTHDGYSEGPDCRVLSLRSSLTTSTLINRVIVASSHPQGTPIVGVAADMDPGSPTYVGRAGFFDLRITSDTITDQVSADAMARLHLGRSLTPAQKIEIQVPPRPDLAYRDVLALTRARAGVWGLWRVQSWTLPLPVPGQPPAPMTIRLASRDLGGADD